MEKETKFVIRGELRKKVLFTLSKPNTPTQLAHKLNKDRPSVSRSILFLLDKGLLCCINPQDKRGRLYTITKKGQKVIKDIKEMV